MPTLGFWAWIVFHGSILLAAEQGTEKPSLVADTPIMTEFSNKVGVLLKTEKFDELDQIAEDLRKQKTTWPDGIRKLNTFYSVLTQRPKLDREWQNFLNLRQKWVDAHPSSVSAYITLADAHIGHAWQARGGGYANTVTEEGWALFKERLTKARQLLEAAEKFSVKDPELYCAFMTLALGQGWPKDQHNELFKKTLEIDAGYYRAYFRRANYLLPRWHGEEDEWIAFMEESVEKTKAEEGEALYARIAWSQLGNELKLNDQLFKKSDISWQRIKQGFLDIEKRYPTSLRNANVFCFFACMAGDKETARALFQHIQGRCDIEAGAWYRESEFKKWEDWAYNNYQNQSVPQYTIKVRGEIESLRLSPDIKVLAVGMNGGDISLYDASLWQEIGLLKGHNSPVQFLAFTPDGKTLISASYIQGAPFSTPNPIKTGEIKFWDVAGKMELATIQAHQGRIYAMTLSPNGKILATGGGGGKDPKEVKLWDTTTHQAIATYPHNAASFCLAFSEDGRILVEEDRPDMYVREVETGTLLKSLPVDILPSPRKWVQSMAVSPNSKTLAFVLGSNQRGVPRTNEVEFWDLTSGAKMDKTLKGHRDTISELAFSPDGKIMATGSSDQTCILWDTATGQPRVTLMAYQGGVTCVHFSSDGKFLVTASWDKTVKIWDVEKVLSASK